ncbi:hypothetical protein ATK30_5643 [Amycolatopsis echigonensis]|uniref:Secreted protein/lipoprotein n=2 Tax=Amycolatopsis echigonensis TaxID=2576905 RepID=A0A2N3WLL5_9PSEU|nr:hypothetical protein ATK30_5643 [Amycolatopsis niigatensis]
MAAGCSAGSPSDPAPAGSSEAPGAPTSAAAPPASTAPADAARQGAVAAYLGMWEDMAAAAKTSNWQDPRLGQHATATALTNITRGLYADKANGLVTKGQPKNSPKVSSVEPPTDPTKVIVADCGDDSNWQHYRADNGQPANDGPSGRRQINAVVERQGDGAWRVTDFGIHEVGSC